MAMRKHHENVRTLLKNYAEAAAAHGRASFEGDYRTANKQYCVIEKIYSGSCDFVDRSISPT